MKGARLKALVWVARPAAAAAGAFEVLLLERPKRRGGGEHPVTGKADEGETPSACARREAEEETALTGELHDLRYSHAFVDERRQRALEEHAFVLVVAAGSEPTLSDEHVAYRWASPEAAERALQWPAHRESLSRALRVLQTRP